MFVALLASLVAVVGVYLPSAAQTGADATFYSVVYIEVTPVSRSTAVAALRRYREASRKEQGFASIELFEQIDRAGHYSVIETWKSAAAFDAHRATPHAQQLAVELQAIRLSAIDQRPYKTLTLAASSATDRSLFVISHVDVGGPQGDAPALVRRLAEISRGEAGNQRFDVLQHTMRANHFTVIAAWRDQKALDAHAAASHTKQYRDALQPLLGSPLDERLYRPAE
jgi:quinol monooxygenase YgiN